MSVNLNPTTPAAVAGNTNVVFQTDGSGNISGYVPTAASVAAAVNLTAQVAAITTTTLYAVPADGLYRVSAYAKITTASDTSSVLGGAAGFQLTWTDPTDSTTPTVTISDQSSQVLNGNTTTTVYVTSTPIAAKASTNIQYAFGYTDGGIVTHMAYKLSIKVESLG